VHNCQGYCSKQSCKTGMEKCVLQGALHISVFVNSACIMLLTDIISKYLGKVAGFEVCFKKVQCLICTER
jgi:hypothetical protein